jgi:protein required for attachment to host cells
MAISWILVANASSARILVNEGPKKGLRLLHDLQHSASREKASDLVSDRPGHYKATGNGHGAYGATIDPKKNEANRFAHEIVQILDRARRDNNYQRLILVAPPTFMGLVNACINNQLTALVSDRIEKDYTKTSDKEIMRHLEHCIYL